MPVVLFHAGVSQVSGGFVGVDIFFVISGYLITSLIIGEISEGRFSLWTFYERRIRRIVPALFTVLAGCTVLAIILVMPHDLKLFGRSLIATVFFVSNIHFYGHSGYFAAPLDTKPLLHTWSLSIEEQFYIVFPVVLLLAFRWGGRRWVGVIGALFIASLVASIWVTAVNPTAAFYLAPMRFWELMLGALLAAGVLPGINSQGLRQAMALAGITLITYAVVTFSPETPFPGASALIPCLGAALLIHAGEGEGSSIVSKALSLWPMVFVGLISYSLYLWHWPLLVFARYWNIGELTGWQASGIVLASFALATVSWTFIEQPFRRKQGPISSQILFAGTATAFGVFLVFGALDLDTKGFPKRFSREVVAIMRDAETPGLDGALQEACESAPTNKPCIVGASVSPSYAIWGDSHARAMIPAVTTMAMRYGKAVAAFVRKACPPVFGLHHAGSEECFSYNVAAMQALESSHDIDTVILISRYAAYVNGDTESRLGRNQPQTLITGNSGEALKLDARSALFGRQLSLTVGRLLAAGKTVVIVYPVPEFGFDVPSAISRLLVTGRDPASFNLPRAKFDERQNLVFSALDKIENSNRLVRVWPHKRLCDSVRCLILADGRSLYQDDDHLSRAGANFVLPEFEPIFDKGGSLVTVGLPTP